MRKNSDGSVDIHVGPKAPDGQEFEYNLTRPGRFVRVVSILMPGEGTFRQEPENAGHREDKTANAISI